MRDLLVGRDQTKSLTPHGIEQAAHTSASLAKRPIHLVISSPQERTRQTARIIADPHGLSVRIDESFDEIDFGRWTGIPFSELETMPGWKNFNAFRSMTRAPGGESITDVQVRSVAAVTQLRTEAVGQTIAIVTHADVIRSLVAYSSGVPLDLFLRFRIDPASITILEIAEWGVSIECVNCTPPLSS